MDRIVPDIDYSRCTLCGDCVTGCPTGAASLTAAGRIAIDAAACSYCGDCEELCPAGAIAVPFTIVSAPDRQEGSA